MLLNGQADLQEAPVPEAHPVKHVPLNK